MEIADFKAACEMVFKNLDINNDGKLQKNECKSFASTLYKQAKQDQEAEFDDSKFDESFDKMDKDSSGTLSLEELTGAALAMAQKSGAVKSE